MTQSYADLRYQSAATCTWVQFSMSDADGSRQGLDFELLPFTLSQVLHGQLRPKPIAHGYYR